MTHALSQDHHPTLRHPDRAAIANELQGVLVVLIDLALFGKHAHWNVVGPHFRMLHLQLDELAAVWLDAADGVAERTAALGFNPDGRAATIAARSQLPALPAGPQRDDELIDALTVMLTEAVGYVRERTERLEATDAVTADLLHGIVASLEQQLWMIRVQGS